MIQSSLRVTNILAFLCCLIILTIGVYLEVAIKLIPCPLCVLQRIIFMVLGILFLVGGLMHFRILKQRIYHLIIAGIALFGVITAGRQVWISHLPPDQLPSCGANLNYLFKILPFQQAVQVLFQGSGSCAEVKWRLLGLSIPEWSLILFVILTGLAIWQAFRKA